jgi:regulator of replication initiation timing
LHNFKSSINFVLALITMTPELKNVINTLKQKIQDIKELHSKVLIENKGLKDEIDKLIAHIELKDKENEQLTKKYESLKLAKTIAASSSDAHDAKVKLNRIVREIDKCISLLNK